MQNSCELTRPIEVRTSCPHYESYRAKRVQSLFNCETGSDFSINAQIPTDEGGWGLGVVVGPSGSGKTSIGREVWPDVGIYNGDEGWPKDAPIVDGIAPGGGFDDVTGALSAVGLGSVPTWLKPYGVISNGEKFRAGLARIVAERPAKVIVDEFTSVIDRQIAKIGAAAFSKAWKRSGGKAILLSCHYDILDWLEPDWVFDTKTGVLDWGERWRRPRFDLEIRQTNSSYWGIFEPHHYLKLPAMVAAKYYVGFVDGGPVCHMAVSPALQSKGMRACRMVVMPEWQGAGVGLKFLDAVCEMQFTPVNKFHDRVKSVFFHTSHPGLCAALRRSKKWVQTSSAAGGVHKGKSASSIAKSIGGTGVGYGGHLRAVNGFKMQRAALALLEGGASNGRAKNAA